jgi:hypothetical protein
MSQVLLIKRLVSREEAFRFISSHEESFLRYDEIAKVVGICTTFLNYHHLNQLLLNIH